MHDILDPDHAAFIESGTSITAASRDAALVPSVAKAVGCRVSADRRSVMLFVVRSLATDLLRDLASTDAIAAVFSQPSTHRTIQLKGALESIAPMGAEDEPLVERCMDSLVADLGRLGYTEPFARAYLGYRRDDMVAIQFRVRAGFVQTPGPAAGQQLAKRAPQ